MKTIWLNAGGKRIPFNASTFFRYALPLDDATERCKLFYEDSKGNEQCVILEASSVDIWEQILSEMPKKNEA